MGGASGAAGGASRAWAGFQGHGRGGGAGPGLQGLRLQGHYISGIEVLRDVLIYRWNGSRTQINGDNYNS